MKTIKNIKRFMGKGSAALTISVIAAVLTAVIAFAVIADLTTPNSDATINDAIFFQASPPTSTGTGVFDPFLRISKANSAVVEGYNTDGTLMYNEDNPWTNSLPLSSVPQVTYEGTLYREFVLDINQVNSESYISLDELQVYLTGDPALTGLITDVSFTSATTLIYDMDALPADDSYVKLDYVLAPGSGKRDMTVLIPDALFGSDPLCNYGEASCSTYVVFYSLFGETFINNDGFEEWGVLIKPYLTVENTVQTSFTRTYLWDIAKSVAPELWDLFDVETGTSRYTVDVTKTGPEDSEWALTGEVTIFYPSERPDGKSLSKAGPAVISDTEVTISGLPVAVDCGVTYPYELSPGETLVCTYASTMPDGSPQTSTATVALVDGASYADDADVIFDGSSTITEVNASINVTDTNGQSWAASSSDSWNYDVTFACDTDEGAHLNTATITETGQWDDATVTVSCYDLSVSKDAATSFTRTYDWEIIKSVTPDVWDLFDGETGTSRYTVAVNKLGYNDSAFAASGNIAVTNNHPSMVAVINSVDDVISPAIAATVECGVDFPYSIAALGTLNCTYSSPLPDGTQQLNTATAVQQLYDYDYLLAATADGTANYQDTADVIVDGSSTMTEVYASINVTDTYEGPLGQVSASDSWNYDRTFACPADEGAHPNTATIDETGQNDSASVTVNCYDIAVAKDAATSFTRTHEWDIEKTVDPDVWHLLTGTSNTSTYTVTVTKTGYTDSDFAASGNITVTNNHPSMVARINSVIDVIATAIDATVVCGVTFPYDIAVGGELTCTYSSPLADATQRLNTATAEQQLYDYDHLLAATAGGTDDYQGTADVIFGDSVSTITHVNQEINVDDTNGQSWGPVSATTSWTYDVEFFCNDDAGEHPNTATIFETGQFDDALVTVYCYAVEIVKDGDPYTKIDPITLLGDTITYDFTIYNNSTLNSPDLDLISVLDVGTGWAGLGDITADAIAGGCDPLASGASCTFSVDYVYQSGDPDPLLSNEVTVLFNPLGSALAVSDSDTHDVEVIHPDFTVTKVCVSEPVAIGADGQFLITIINTGDVPLIINTDEAGIPADIALGVGETYSDTVSKAPVPGASEIPNTVIVTATLPEIYELDNSMPRESSASCEIQELAAFTPGFWKNHGPDAPSGNNAWEYLSGTYSTTTFIYDVFDPTYLNVKPKKSSIDMKDYTLIEGLAFQGGKGTTGAKEILLRAAIAALLNADLNETLALYAYQYTPTEVIALVNAALDPQGETEDDHRQRMITVAGDFDWWNNFSNIDFDWDNW